MSTYTYTDARQKLAQVLDEANGPAGVFIKRKNGQLFQITPVDQLASGLDVPGVDVDIATDEMVQLIRGMREKRSAHA